MWLTNRFPMPIIVLNSQNVVVAAEYHPYNRLGWVSDEIQPFAQ